ncbi:MAG: peptidase M48 [Bdellovibrionales bacterium RIFOXYD12_FULL_39_22]|nr:MAG: peptidase M48 [Bdellovibrionales bacterium RIFOXYB1_FULL_39_21]OFZ40924.1 MAG: peptidase M48 [Bdellovibrionales bacterium RIFOXYC12_FULL_39_17]OFZ44732.1 MAG: peptidase M48 [Bdellovibrionales bacterium RIFOXYC1_FULL_39_130]OFZ69678.1 MAG: peptidase M48 [Bdellovibrionales bacterium RIFOXYC2_FULL_39_8]OFZ74183.1 MAG: peptidase M48 [Bdellovibrionales bacterium RIFOXYD1_FULL_39_84]OFZ92063.1 MAG: peptidase M48 [Bdellovibrionales bacterium RIFOXYD12_FULL_39_22]HLE10618.1 M48 family metallo
MQTTSEYTYLFISFLALRTLIELYLKIRQRQHIIKHRSMVPTQFQQTISLADHQKAADYNVTRINSSFFFYLLDLALLLAWTYGGGLNYLDYLLHPLNLSPLHQGVLYLFSFSLISAIIDLPQTLYATFVIEKKFGFNKTTPKLFMLDLLKGVILFAVLATPLLYSLLFIFDFMGNLWWIYAWAFLAIFQLIMVWLYPSLIAPWFNKFAPLNDTEITDKISNLLDRCKLKNSGIFTMDASKRSSHGDAYFTGLGKNKRIVFFDTLISTLSPNEIVAVLAHELGHYKKKHILQHLIISSSSSLLGFFILGQVHHIPLFFSTHGVINNVNYLALLLFVLISPVYTFFITPLFSFLSRKNEFAADRFASENSNAQDLIAALTKLYKDNASTLTPDPLYSAIYHSHPPAQIRIEKLLKLS